MKQTVTVRDNLVSLYPRQAEYLVSDAAFGLETTSVLRDAPDHPEEPPQRRRLEGRALLSIRALLGGISYWVA
jgi:hypothetical protein